MAQLSHVGAIILGTAVAKFIAITLCAAVASLLVDEQWTAFHYYPAAAVDVVGLLALGYWAAPGAAIGCLVWNVWQLDIGFTQHIVVAGVAAVCCIVVLWIFNTYIEPERRFVWVAPTLSSALKFTSVYAAVSTICAPAALAYGAPDHNLTARDLAALFGGIFVGTLSGFIALNLTFSAYLSRRLRRD